MNRYVLNPCMPMDKEGSYLERAEESRPGIGERHLWTGHVSLQVKFYWCTAMLTHLHASMAALMQSREAVADNVWPTNPTIFTPGLYRKSLQTPGLDKSMSQGLARGLLLMMPRGGLAWVWLLSCIV